MEKRNLRRVINAHLSMVDLLRKHFHIHARVGGTLLCPFHDDSRKSAKLYPDNAVYCFTEAKMYRPYDLLKFVGLKDSQIEALAPIETFVPMTRSVSVSEEVLRDIRGVFIKTGKLEYVVSSFYEQVRRCK